MNKHLHEFFAKTFTYLEKSILPIGNELDYNVSRLKKSYLQLKKLRCLKLLIPLEYGGLGGDRAEWIKYNIQMSKYSGALLFLQAQHQSAIASLKKLLPQEGAKKILQVLAKKNQGIGICLAANSNIIKVKKIYNDFILSGKLPWVTGYDYFENILFSFDYEGVSYYTLLPFKNSSALKISQPLNIAVFKSTNTVSVDLKNLTVTQNTIIAKMSDQAKKPTEHPAIYNFAGAAKALLEISTKAKYFERASVKQTYDFLLNEWRTYYKQILRKKNCPLKLRAQGFELVNKCVTFARMVCGSAGVLSSHPLTRISREIWQYAVAGYSSAQVDAYINEELHS